MSFPAQHGLGPARVKKARDGPRANTILNQLFCKDMQDGYHR